MVIKNTTCFEVKKLDISPRDFTFTLRTMSDDVSGRPLLGLNSRLKFCFFCDVGTQFYVVLNSVAS